MARRWSPSVADRTDELVTPIREADVGVVNLEHLLHDFEGYPVDKLLPFCAPPWVADELVAAGFDLFGLANNHANDYWHGGMDACMRALDERDVAYAGLGETLATARAPTYVDSPGGRVALVAASSTYQPGSEAAPRSQEMQGRPGISPLRLHTRYVVPDEVFESVRKLGTLLDIDEEKRRRMDLGLLEDLDEDDGRYHLLPVGSYLGSTGGSTLVVERGDEPRIEQRVNEDDADAIRRQIRAADRQADWVVVSFHTHEGAGGKVNHPSVPQFAEEFARSCIDAGADAVVGHGPHILRGIEVYEDAPIFYSLGNFVLHHETIARYPARTYELHGIEPDSPHSDLYDGRIFGHLFGEREPWESVLPVCRFDDGGLAEIELYPIDLGYDAPRPQRGFPKLASGADGERIIDRLAGLSEPYGVDVTVENGTGTIQP